MENLTTPKAILFGLSLIALAIASVPYSSKLVKNAYADNIQKVQICGYSFKRLNFENKKNGIDCVGIQEIYSTSMEKGYGSLFVNRVN